MRRVNPNSLVLVVALVAGCAQGHEEQQPAQPWALPIYSGDATQTHMAPDAPKPARPVPDARELWDRALGCWPVGSLMNAEVLLEGRVRTQPSAEFDGATITTGARSSVGVLVRVPLYSGAEVDRERQREFMRRTKAAEAVGALLTALTDGERVRREIELMKALERRAQQRVRLGVVETSEQVRYLEKVASLESEKARYGASTQRARLDLLALCAAERVNALDGFILPYIEFRP